MRKSSKRSGGLIFFRIFLPGRGARPSVTESLDMHAVGVQDEQRCRRRVAAATAGQPWCNGYNAPGAPIELGRILI